jgi:hypothetical protein
MHNLTFPDHVELFLEEFDAVYGQKYNLYFKL